MLPVMSHLATKQSPTSTLLATASIFAAYVQVPIVQVAVAQTLVGPRQSWSVVQPLQTPAMHTTADVAPHWTPSPLTAVPCMPLSVQVPCEHGFRKLTGTSSLSTAGWIVPPGPHCRLVQSPAT
jgi:hypothetical protein